MKKLSILALLTLTLLLSGCGEEKSFPDNGSVLEKDLYCQLSYNNDTQDCIDYKTEKYYTTTFYTQSQVDEMLDSYWYYDYHEEWEEFMFCTDKLYDHTYCVVMAQNNAWSDEIDTLEQRIAELENQDIETNITYTTLAMLDILIYMYDEELASGTVFTDEEVLYYDMLEMMRAEYITALEGE